MDCNECSNVFGRVVSNGCSQDLNITVMGKQFIVPPRSTFLLSDLSHISPLYDYACEHNIMYTHSYVHTTRTCMHMIFCVFT